MTEEELKQLKPARQVDCKGQICPGPLIDAKIGISTIPLGEVMEVVASEDASCDDITILAEKTGHEFLGCIEEDYRKRLFVKRGK